MRKWALAIIAFSFLGSAAHATAQEAGLGEIIVTAQRSGDYYSDEQTVIGLRRMADSAVQEVLITSDSRDENTRKKEIRSMMESAIRKASGTSIELVVGDFELHPVTLANYQDIALGKGSRPDTSQISFYVKSKLGGSPGSAQDRIDAFIGSVPTNGRSLIEPLGDLTLTIINPDQYRDQIVKLIAAESTKYAGYFGADYGVDVGGLDGQIHWAQASLSEVFLYIPYRFSIKPK